MQTIHHKLLRDMMKPGQSIPKEEGSWHFNLYAILSLIVLILLYSNMTLHDELLALKERLAEYGDCRPITSRSGDITVQHCVRTIAKE